MRRGHCFKFQMSSATIIVTPHKRAQLLSIIIIYYYIIYSIIIVLLWIRSGDRSIRQSFLSKFNYLNDAIDYIMCLYLREDNIILSI